MNGFDAVRYTTGTAAVTAVNVRHIQCITDTVFSVLTRTGATGTLVGATIPAGTVLFGPFTAYTLASGVVAAYD